MKRQNRMIIRNGIIRVHDGTVTSLDLRNCTLFLGPKVVLVDCMLDANCRVEVSK